MIETILIPLNPKVNQTAKPMRPFYPAIDWAYMSIAGVGVAGRNGGSWRFGGSRERHGVALAFESDVAPARMPTASPPRCPPLFRCGVDKDVLIDDLPEVPVQQLYRTMDFVWEADESLQREVCWSVGNLLNLEADLLYFDTTSTYFEIEDEDKFRKKSHSARTFRNASLPQREVTTNIPYSG